MEQPLVIIDDKLHEDAQPFLMVSKCTLCGRERSATCCEMYLSHLTDDYLEQVIVNYKKSLERVQKELFHRKHIKSTIEQWLLK